ncbi:MAG TPA: hypothetical protein VNM43_11470 [Dehalococcoidia bacterium]|nr:hypothetical protein [Dehalococcoidia bacterium]
MNVRPRKRQRLLVDAATFVQRVEEEIERSDRYGHPFTMLLLEAPAGLAVGRLETLRRVAAAARSLVRGCDLVAVFERPGMFAVLLPETTVSGAARVLERFQTQIDDASGTWNVRLAMYPYDRAAIEAFLRKAA